MQSYDANRGHSNFFRVFLSELLRHMAGFYDKQKKTPLESVASRGVFLYHNDWRTYSKLIDVTADENNVILQVFFLDEK